MLPEITLKKRKKGTLMENYGLRVDKLRNTKYNEKCLGLFMYRVKYT